MTVKPEPHPAGAHRATGYPDKSTHSYGPVWTGLPLREAEIGVVGTSRLPHPAQGWDEGFPEEANCGKFKRIN